ncbi:MAG: hypothetical protein WEB03_11860 [Nitriliruptor sp.]|uniref:hypothetical protein n=1 Tax=Nitriliruptor sp. TaxID=2448056 RepID=UPI0034A07E98
MSDDLTVDGATTDGPLAGGLEPGARFRCDQCGNVTRFDVIASERTRRYLHFDLGGSSAVDEEEVLERTVESVTCRWCGRDDAVRVEPAPAGADPVAPA